jgi:hypothetical protein
VLFVVNGLIKGEIENPSGQYLGLICDESLTYRGLKLNPGHFHGSILPSCPCRESCLHVSWCVGGRCGMAGSDEDRGRSRRPSAEDRGWSSIGRVLGSRVIRRSGDTVCSLDRAHEDKEREFLG